MHAQQQKITSQFDAASTADAVIGTTDLRGRCAIVTGGASGIGLHTTRVLAAAGAQVIVAVRNPAKARDELARHAWGPGGEDDRGNITVMAMDLADPASIDHFADDLNAKGIAVDFLINNAGIMGCPLTRDSRGYEAQFATNHLGHFQLTLRLEPALRRADQARIVSVSSAGHRFAPVNFDDPHFVHRDYDRWQAYGQSKTANILFARELDRRAMAFGIRAFSLHPGGIVETGLSVHMPREDIIKMGYMTADGQAVIDPYNGKKTPAQGAATSVWCATSPDLAGMGGVYCADCNIVTPVAADHEGAPGLWPWANDGELAQRLWRDSVAMTGVDGFMA